MSNGIETVRPPRTFARSVLSAPAEIAAGSHRKRGEDAGRNAPDRQNRLPLRHPRSCALRLSIAAFGHSAVDNAQGASPTTWKSRLKWNRLRPAACATSSWVSFGRSLPPLTRSLAGSSGPHLRVTGRGKSCVDLRSHSDQQRVREVFKIRAPARAALLGFLHLQLAKPMDPTGNDEARGRYAVKRGDWNRSGTAPLQKSEGEHLLLIFGRTVGRAHSHAAEPDSRNFQVAISEFALQHFLNSAL